MNYLDANGLTVNTYNEVVTAIATSLTGIYGDDININSDTPDGQAINIFAQAIIDVQNFLVSIYNSFDPDLAIGVVLDQRVALNGVQRNGGTYTQQNISIQTDRSITLQGLDGLLPSEKVGNEYLVSDSLGTNFILANTTVITGAGTTVHAFQSVNPGAVQTIPNTIKTAVTIVLGVLSVNNPTVATLIGLDEETDSALRLRRQKSVSLASQGYSSSLESGLLNIVGVTYAKVYENNTSSVDVDGIPGHSIWAIAGGGLDYDIAYAIYTKRNAGCGMKGSTLVQVTQPNGSLFEILFDRTLLQNLYIKFNAASIDGITALNTTYLADGLAANISTGVNESVNINQIAAELQALDTNCLSTSIQVSADGTTWANIVSPQAKNYRFALVAGNINITVV